MRDFGVIFKRFPLMCDNINAISVAKNPVFHKRMKHLEWRHHFLRDHVEKGDKRSVILIQRDIWPIFSPNLLMLLTLLLCRGGIGVCHPFGLV
jgi:hypothetical protein